MIRIRTMAPCTSGSFVRHVEQRAVLVGPLLDQRPRGLDRAASSLRHLLTFKSSITTTPWFLTIVVVALFRASGALRTSLHPGDAEPGFGPVARALRAPPQRALRGRQSLPLLLRNAGNFDDDPVRLDERLGAKVDADLRATVDRDDRDLIRFRGAQEDQWVGGSRIL